MLDHGEPHLLELQKVRVIDHNHMWSFLVMLSLDLASSCEVQLAVCHWCMPCDRCVGRGVLRQWNLGSDLADRIFE